MRILFVNTMFPSPLHPRILGGAEVFSQRLTSALVQRGHDVEVLRSGPTLRRWPAEVEGVRIETLPILNLYAPSENRSENLLVRAAWHLLDDRLGSQSRIVGKLDSFKPDVVHTNNLPGIGTAIWKAATARNVPVVHTLHDYYLICAKFSRFRAGHACTQTCRDCRALTVKRRAATPLVTTAVGVSRRMLEIHQRNGIFENPEACAVITNAPPAFSKYALPGGPRSGELPIVYGFIGRPTLEKGVFDLAAALGRAPLGSARLVIAGTINDADRATLSGLAGTTEVVFRGFVTPEAFFQDVDVTVVPSRWEDPCPTVVAESLGWSKPVLGARIGGIPELVDETASGWLFDPDTPGMLEQTLMHITMNPSEVRSRQDWLHARGHARSFDDQTDEYQDVYRAAIERHTKPAGRRPA